MVKKICSTILSVLLLCTVCLPVLTAGAEGVVVDVPEVTVTVYEANVSITVARRDTLTLKVYQLAEDPITGDMNPAGNPVYVGVSSPAPTPVEVTGGDSVIRTYYTHTFPAFNFDRTTPTGDYRAVVANTYEVDFPFVNKIDKINFYNALAGTASDAMEAKLQEGKDDGYLPYVSATYFGLDSSIKGKVNKGLADYPFPTLTLDPLATDAELIDFEDELQTEYDRLMQAADLVTAAEGDAFVAAVTAATAAPLSMTLGYYNHVDPNLRPAPANVRARLMTLVPADFSTATVQNAFDLSVLLAIVDTMDAGTVTDALAHYDGGCVTLDATYASTLSTTQKNSLSTKLKEIASSLTTKEILEQKYAELAEQIAGGGGASSPVPGPGPGPAPGPGPGTSAPVVPSIIPGSTGTTTPGTQSTFKDLSADHWAAPAIEYLASKGVISGKGDGKFYPEDLVTREEFTKIMVEAFRLHNKDAKADFTDVAPERWSYSYIASALEAGLINGVNETEFAPAAYISRQDMAVIIYRAAQLLGVDLSGKSANFADNSAIASYAKEAVAKLAGAGIINGVENNRFAPQGLVTRAQAAKIVYELAMKNGGIM